MIFKLCATIISVLSLKYSIIFFKTACSVILSSSEVASSKITILAWLKNILASAIRYLFPPEILIPFSPNF
jgi:hypothetical protein